MFIPYALHTETDGETLVQEWNVLSDDWCKRDALLRIIPTEILEKSETVICNNSGKGARKPRHAVCKLEDVPGFKEWKEARRRFMECPEEGLLEEISRLDDLLIGNVDGVLVDYETQTRPKKRKKSGCRKPETKPRD